MNGHASTLPHKAFTPQALLHHPDAHFDAELLSCSRSRNCGAVSASARAQSHMIWMCSAGNLRGAPLRGGMKQAIDTFCKSGITMHGHGIPIQALFGCHGVARLVTVKHQQRARALASPPITAAFGDVGQLLSLCFSQKKGAWFARHLDTIYV